jgi:predicted dehydrogenase
MNRCAGSSIPAVNIQLSPITRRRFLGHTAIGGSGLLLLKSARSAWSAEANEKLNLALIGVGGRGGWFANTMPRLGQNLVALCDVDDSKNPDAYQQLPKARKFRDFRKLFDEMGQGIDAVIVATPDHTHAVASAAAIKAGKHVYCEKPLTRTVHESRALRELARKHKVATSMGNQGTAAGPFRRALELIRDGAVGEIQEVHVWNSEGGADRKDPPTDGGPVPEFLDWDLWLGPAALRPYHRQWMQRHLWRDLGTCQLGNWGSHSANLAFMALKVHDLWLSPSDAAKPPLIRIEAKHSGVNRLSFPKWEVVKWNIPARTGLPPITFTWHNGRAPGSRDLLEGNIGEELDWGDKKDKKWVDHGGAIIVGTKGRVRATEHNATFRLLPADQFKGIQASRPEKVTASLGHEQDWLRACRGGQPAWANFDYADALNEFLMLGNVATQFESPLEFDPIAMKIVNNPAADALLRSEYRSGWTL